MPATRCDSTDAGGIGGIEAAISLPVGLRTPMSARRHSIPPSQAPRYLSPETGLSTPVQTPLYISRRSGRRRREWLMRGTLLWASVPIAVAGEYTGDTGSTDATTGAAADATEFFAARKEASGLWIVAAAVVVIVAAYALRQDIIYIRQRPRE